MRKKRDVWKSLIVIFAALVGLTGLSANALEGRPPVSVEWSEDRFFAELKSGRDEVAAKILEKGIEEGDTFARCQMAVIQFVGLLGVPDFERAATLLNGLDFWECPEKAYFLSIAYRDGRGVPKDARMAEHFFRKEAVFFHYVVLEDERPLRTTTGVIDIAADTRRASKWWRAFQYRMDAGQKLDLAVAYLKGDGVPRDEDVGYRFLHLAAKAGSDRARELLRNAIDEGKTESYQPDAFMFAGRREAVMRLPRFYEEVTLDRRRLGYGYLNGDIGVKPMPEKAYIWLLAEEAAGATDVAPALRKLEAELPPEVIEWAREWVENGWWL